MKAVFSIWGGFGLLLCGIVTLSTLGPNASALLYLPAVSVALVGGLSCAIGAANIEAKYSSEP